MGGGTSRPTASLHEGVDPFERALIDAMPALTRYARKLCGGHRADAEDLAQETLARALGGRHQFTPGTCMQAWLYTIARNARWRDGQRRARCVADPDGTHAAGLTSLPRQHHRLELIEAVRGVLALDARHRSTLGLIVFEGLGYAEAAARTGVPIGTVRSRMNRARQRLEAFG
ncbi:MAG: RNA polymerase sigma factor [Alphaproteobacteria bacterium]